MSGYPKAYGRYVLEDRIAMGGMAEIFRARTATQGFEKRVCIKRILPHFLEDEEFVTMFRDEARTAAKLQHANVVQVFDFGTEEGSLYLAMELVDGADLRRILEASRKKRIPLEIGEAVQISIDMCKGLHHAHTLLENGRPLGLVHRDISPHNVLVSRAGEVKVTDFGIAKAAERATHTSTGIVKGKVAYMAPEQAQGFPFDHRLDQFAAGIVLWEMLAGSRLFTGETDIVILKKVLACDVPAPSALRKGVPASLDDIVLKALAQHASDRFADMRQMELALSRLLFSGAIDPATAEVRNVFPRIMADADPALRKTQIADAPAPEETATPADLDHVSKTESQSRIESGSSLPAPSPSSSSSSSSSNVSMVFSSSEKAAPAPGPAASPGAALGGVDPNAVTMMEVSDESLRAPGPILSPASSGKSVKAPSAPIPTAPGLPSMAELSRLDEASAALQPAPDATPATRTNVPRGASVSAAAPVAEVTTATSATPKAALAPADGIDALALPRSRAPLVAAGVVAALATAALMVRSLADDEVPAPPPIAAQALQTAVAPAVPPSGPVVPVEATPAVVPVATGESKQVEAPVLEKPVLEKPVDAKPVAKKARIQVLVKATGRWVYFVSPTGEKVEIYSGGTPMTLPEGKGKFKLITQEGKTVLVPLEVTAGKTLLLPAM